MRALVTGATGTVGRLVVPHLLEAGVAVRALTRRPETANLPTGVEVIAGDLVNPDSLAHAFDAVDVVFLIAADDQTDAVVEMARKAGVSRIVTLSSASAGFQDNPGGNYHRDFELAVERSQLDWTHIRPGMFATNLLDWGEAIKTSRTVRAPFDNARQAPVHEEDVAAVAAAAITSNAHIGAVYTLSGPESLTKSEQIAVISAAIGETVQYEEITPEQWRTENPHLPSYVGDWLLGYWQNALSAPEPVLPDVSNVLGRPATPLLTWARDHREEFL